MVLTYFLMPMPKQSTPRNKSGKQTRSQNSSLYHISPRKPTSRQTSPEPSCRRYGIYRVRVSLVTTRRSIPLSHRVQLLCSNTEAFYRRVKNVCSRPGHVSCDASRQSVVIILKTRVINDYVRGMRVLFKKFLRLQCRGAASRQRCSSKR